MTSQQIRYRCVALFLITIFLPTLIIDTLQPSAPLSGPLLLVVCCLLSDKRMVAFGRASTGLRNTLRSDGSVECMTRIHLPAILCFAFLGGYRDKVLRRQAICLRISLAHA